MNAYALQIYCIRDSVVTVSHKSFVDLGSSEIDEFSNLLALETDYSAESINTLMANLSSFKGYISRVVICNGILHDDQKDIFPEKNSKISQKVR